MAVIVISLAGINIVVTDVKTAIEIINPMAMIVEASNMPPVAAFCLLRVSIPVLSKYAPTPAENISANIITYKSDVAAV